MSAMWKETTIEMDITDWQGNPLRLTEVPAVQDVKTGNIRVYPSEVAKAEAREFAKGYGVEAHDVSLLLALYAKPGIFKGGEVHYGYHLNKILFYQWKELEKEGLGDAMGRDEFVAADRGPIPENIVSDLERLSRAGLLSIEHHPWGKGPKDASKSIHLTESGLELADKIWWKIPDIMKEITLKVKEQIFPLTPEEVREKVHREYPEYRKGYIVPDKD